jgi:hypothetical protein
MPGTSSRFVWSLGLFWTVISKENHRRKSQLVQLSDLESFIKRGLDEGTIEWAGMSDFLFHPLSAEVAFMLCNDADLHFASADSSLLLELGHKISSSGIKVTIPAVLFD